MLRRPDPDEAFDRLAPLFPVSWEALEFATEAAKEACDGFPFAFDPHVFAGLTRNFAIMIFDARGAMLNGYVRSPLPNGGIQITYAGYDLRIYKGTNGELPGWVGSPTRQRFFQQVSLFDPEPDRSASSEHFVGGNLIVLWEYDRFANQLDLALICPKPGQDVSDPSEPLWMRPIPHPGESHGFRVTPARSDDIDDLDTIRPKEARGEGEGS